MLQKLYIGACGQFKIFEFHHNLEGVFFKVIIIIVELSFIHFGERMLPICWDGVAGGFLRKMKYTLAYLLLDLLYIKCFTYAFFAALWMSCGWAWICWDWSCFQWHFYWAMLDWLWSAWPWYRLIANRFYIFVISDYDCFYWSRTWACSLLLLMDLHH